MGGSYFIIIIFIMFLYVLFRLYLYYWIGNLYNRSYLDADEVDIDIDKIKEDYVKLFDEKYIS